MILDHLVIQKMDTSGRTILSGQKKSYSQFNKDELSTILKFGATNLFQDEEKQSESERENAEEKKDGELNIDEILERAETTSSSAPEESSSFLSAFKVANFSVIEAEKEKEKKEKQKEQQKKRAKKDTFWEDLIPQEERATAEAEKLYMPKRRRTVKSYAEDDIFSEATAAAEAETQGRHRRSRRTNTENICNLTLKEAKAFIRTFKKYMDPEKMERVLSEADLEHILLEDAEEMGRKLLEKCKQAVEAETNDSDSTKKKTIQTTFCKVNLNALELAERAAEIEALKQKLSSCEDPEEFEVYSNTRASRQWAVKWTNKDDARLLRGILRHGVGNWEDIRRDTALGLQDKICPINTESSSKKIKGPQLKHRVDILLKQIRQEHEEDKQLLDLYKEEEPMFDPDIWRQCPVYFKPVQKALKQFQQIDDDSKRDTDDRLSKIKKYLLILGTAIHDTASDFTQDQDNKERMIVNMWFYVHKTANTSGDSATLRQLFERLAENKVKEDSKKKTTKKKTTKKAASSTRRKRKKASSDGEDPDDEEYTPKKRTRRK